MDARGLFTKEEISAIKERIVHSVSLHYFLTTKKVQDPEEGEIEFQTIQPRLQKEIERIVDEELKSFVKNYLKDIVHGIVKDRVQKSVERFTQKLCDQLEKITTKTNWYWSIR